MTSQPSITVYRASWVLPVGQPPIENGFVAVDRGTILAFGPNRCCSVSAKQVVDLGDGAIIPGLVNAHTHLEFSSLERPLGTPGVSFTDWIRLVVDCRTRAARENQKRVSIRRGLGESFQAGVWAIGDIATPPFLLDVYQGFKQPISVTLFSEQLGRDRSQFDAKQQAVDEFLGWSSTGSSVSQILGAASPHAPYSVHPELLRRICDIARNRNCPVAMHVAETREEIELLESQTGEFVTLLKDLGVWDPGSFLPVCSILTVLEMLSGVPRSLVVHGNYLTNLELDFVATQRGRMSIVFCPRTHRYFEHGPYPLMEMLRREIPVALGTDSRASNPDLDLFEEMKQVASQFPEVPRSQVLEMGTVQGAVALGISEQFGTISVGRKAAMSFVAQGNGVESGADVFDWLLASESHCVPVLT